MRKLHEFFRLKHEFSYTILNPLEVCIQRIEAHQSGCSRFFTKTRYDISRVDDGLYHIECQYVNTYLEAELSYHDNYKTIVHGWTKIENPNRLSGVIPYFASMVWTGFLVYAMSSETNILVGILCTISALIFAIFVVVLSARSQHRFLTREFLNIISVTEPEKKKKRD